MLGSLHEAAELAAPAGLGTKMKVQMIAWPRGSRGLLPLGKLWGKERSREGNFLKFSLRGPDFWSTRFCRGIGNIGSMGGEKLVL